MLWHKEILTATVTAGTGAVNTIPLKGKIEQMVVTALNGTVPQNVSWTLNVLDKEDDAVLQITHIGRLDDRTLLPVGKDVAEKYTFVFTAVAGTVTTMRTFMKVREVV